MSRFQYWECASCSSKLNPLWSLDNAANDYAKSEDLVKMKVPSFQLLTFQSFEVEQFLTLRHKHNYVFLSLPLDFLFPICELWKRGYYFIFETTWYHFFLTRALVTGFPRSRVARCCLAHRFAVLRAGGCREGRNARQVKRSNQFFDFWYSFSRCCYWYL